MPYRSHAQALIWTQYAEERHETLVLLSSFRINKHLQTAGCQNIAALMKHQSSKDKSREHLQTAALYLAADRHTVSTGLIKKKQQIFWLGKF